MWDVYLQSSDPFLCFFMALVILVNARDQILEKEEKGKKEIIGLYDFNNLPDCKLYLNPLPDMPVLGSFK